MNLADWFKGWWKRHIIADDPYPYGLEAAAFVEEAAEAAYHQRLRLEHIATLKASIALAEARHQARRHQRSLLLGLMAEALQYEIDNREAA